jgi:hypothetical protein
MSSEITQVLAEIIRLLGDSGHAERAQWLALRRARLLDPDVTPDEQDSVRGELQQVLHGMGGLLDLRLEPDPTTGLTVHSSRQQLDALADRLHQLTK